MDFSGMLKTRRSVYGLNKNLPVFTDKIINLVRNSVRYVPDAFDMKSQRVIVVMGDAHEKFWNAVYDELVKYTGGPIPRERLDSFAAAAGTILYFFDSAVVNETRVKYPLYAGNFHDWVMQSNGMLQFAIWTGLAEMGVGANLQHYNPVIDKMVARMFDLPEAWVLVAEMPFGGIAEQPSPKMPEDIDIRVKIEK
ncbi:MAG: nitroreductase family protein [Alphaproteobacteria bacterium]|nr:nitroreductase family protein [Alphaproteobacteria bacterium]